MISYGSANRMDELEAVGEIYRHWTDFGYDSRWILHNSYALVAREGGNIVGVAQLIIVPDPFWHRNWGLVENVFVLSEYRRMGIGRGLMRQAELQARMFGCRYIKLTSSKVEGQALYEALGYEEGKSYRKELE